MDELDLGHRTGRRWGERVIAGALFLCGLVSILTTVGIVAQTSTSESSRCSTGPC